MNPKNTLLLVSLAALACLAFAQTPKPPQAPPGSDLALRVASLETEMILLKAQVSQTRAGNAQLATFVRAQADSAQKLAAVLDDSEAKGFTYGINPDSRTVLLAGLREFLAGMQQNVPAAVPIAVPVEIKTGTPATPPAKGY